MSKEELSFEELPDGSRIITIQGINQFGEKYIRQDRIKCPAVWDALKRLTYTAEDMENIATWVFLHHHDLMYRKISNGFIEEWEQERRTK